VAAELAGGHSVHQLVADEVMEQPRVAMEHRQVPRQGEHREQHDARPLQHPVPPRHQEIEQQHDGQQHQSGWPLGDKGQRESGPHQRDPEARMQ
jgi:hypothetical protein